MTACLTCGGGYGKHDDRAHDAEAHTGRVYGIDPPDPCGTCDGTGLVDTFTHIGVTCPECDGWGVS